MRFNMWTLMPLSALAILVIVLALLGWLGWSMMVRLGMAHPFEPPQCEMEFAFKARKPFADHVCVEHCCWEKKL